MDQRLLACSNGYRGGDGANTFHQSGVDYFSAGCWCGRCGELRRRRRPPEPASVSFPQVCWILLACREFLPWSWSRPVIARALTAPCTGGSLSVLPSGRITDGGGEQVAAILTLLILPLALTDGRTWHWQVEVGARPIRSERDAVVRLVAFCAAWIIQLQVAYIYIDAVLEKLKVPEWLNGTVMYYVWSNNYFGAPHYLMGKCSRRWRGACQ